MTRASATTAAMQARKVPWVVVSRGSITSLRYGPK